MEPILYPNEHLTIFPGASAAWQSIRHITELDKRFSGEIPQLANDIRRIYDSLNDKEVLDLGCGTGRLIEAFPNMLSYIGVDQSSAMLAVARRKFPAYMFIHSSIEDYRNSDHFDAVTCIDVLQHLDSPPEKLLRRILVLFNADIFIFRTHVSNTDHVTYYNFDDARASAAYPLNYFVTLTETVREHTDCTATLNMFDVPTDDSITGIYIVCERDS